MENVRKLSARHYLTAAEAVTLFSAGELSTAVHLACAPAGSTLRCGGERQGWQSRPACSERNRMRQKKANGWRMQKERSRRISQNEGWRNNKYNFHTKVLYHAVCFRLLPPNKLFFWKCIFNLFLILNTPSVFILFLIFHSFSLDSSWFYFLFYLMHQFSLVSFMTLFS